MAQRVPVAAGKLAHGRSLGPGGRPVLQWPDLSRQWQPEAQWQPGGPGGLMGTSSQRSLVDAGQWWRISQRGRFRLLDERSLFGGPNIPPIGRQTFV